MRTRGHGPAGPCHYPAQPSPDHDPSASSVLRLPYGRTELQVGFYGRVLGFLIRVLGFRFGDFKKK